MIKRIFCIILALFALTLCGCKNGGGADEGQGGDKLSYTLMIYMCGSTLESKNGNASKNLAELVSADIPEGVNIVIQTGGAKRWYTDGISALSTDRYAVEGGELVMRERISRLLNFGEAQTLADFAAWAAENYPAEKYGLILWNHGGGSLGGVCFDENFANDALNLTELDSAFSSAVESTGRKFEFIGFDACLMATYETAYVVKQYAANMVASQELEPAGGWNYVSLVQNLGKEGFYEEVLHSYAQKSASKNYYTLSHIDFSRFSVVEDMFADLLGTLKAEKTPRKTINALRTTANFGMTDSVNADLFDFGGLCSALSINGEINDCIRTVNGTLHSSASGISLYFPLNSYSNLEQYGTVCSLTEYVDYLESFYSARDTETISFLSYAENENNRLSFRLTADSLKNVQDVSYSLYQFEQDGNRERVFSLGTDSEVNVSSSKITVNFTGNWAMLEGKLLCCDLLGEIGDLIFYSSPVTVDLMFADLLFVYDATDKSSEILGVIYEGEEGRIYDLEEGQVIRVTRREVTDGTVSEWDYEQDIVYSKDTHITVSVLSDGLYQYTAYVTDVYGNRFTAGTAVVRIDNGQQTILYVTSDEPVYNPITIS